MNRQPTRAMPPLISEETSLMASCWLDIVKKQVERLKFGSVNITVHENRVVQVETSSRIRFDKTQ
jgi:hypothetical protein